MHWGLECRTKELCSWVSWCALEVFYINGKTTIRISGLWIIHILNNIESKKKEIEESLDTRNVLPNLEGLWHLSEYSVRLKQIQPLALVSGCLTLKVYKVTKESPGQLEFPSVSSLKYNLEKFWAEPLCASQLRNLGSLCRIHELKKRKQMSLLL